MSLGHRRISNYKTHIRHQGQTVSIYKVTGGWPVTDCIVPLSVEEVCLSSATRSIQNIQNCSRLLLTSSDRKWCQEYRKIRSVWTTRPRRVGSDALIIALSSNEYHCFPVQSEHARHTSFAWWVVNTQSGRYNAGREFRWTCDRAILLVADLICSIGSFDLAT